MDRTTLLIYLLKHFQFKQAISLVKQENENVQWDNIDLKKELCVLEMFIRKPIRDKYIDLILQNRVVTAIELKNTIEAKMEMKEYNISPSPTSYKNDENSIKTISRS